MLKVFFFFNFIFFYYQSKNNEDTIPEDDMQFELIDLLSVKKIQRQKEMIITFGFFFFI